MIQILYIILLIIEPLYGIYRLRKCQKQLKLVSFILNPMLYFFGFSYLYFIIPGLLIDIYPSLLGYKFSVLSIQTVKKFYFYYGLVLFLFYMISKDNKIEIRKNFLGARYSCILKLILIAFSIIYMFILLLEFPRIYRLRANRITAFSYYAENVYSRYKITFINITIIIDSFLLFLNSEKKLKSKIIFLLPCIFIMLLDYSHGGRSESIKVAIEIIILFIIETKKLPLKEIIVFLFILIVPTFLQRSVGMNQLIVAFGEFFFSGMSPLVVLDKNLSLPFGDLVGNFFLSPFPGFIRRLVQGDTQFYWAEIEKNFGYGFGLAGNLVAEGLIYGKNIFSYLSPIIIGCFVSFVNDRYKRSLYAFIFSFLLIMTSQNMMRTSFYMFFLPIFYMAFVYCIYLFCIFKRKVFITGGLK